MQDRPQAGKESEAEDGRRVTLWERTAGRSVDTTSATAAAVPDRGVMAKCGAGERSTRSERTGDHGGESEEVEGVE